MVEDARRALDGRARLAHAARPRAGAAASSRGSSTTRPTRSPTSRRATPASRSPRPRPTSPRRSATSSTTRARSSASRAARSRSAPTRSTTRSASRGACAARSSRGTTRCRSTARCAAPALAAGNAVILKPSELASITPLRLAELAERAGVPRGMIQIATGHGETGAALVEHRASTTSRSSARPRPARRSPRRARSGSPRSSSSSAASRPNVVFADADLDKAVPAIVKSLLQNAGQSCSAGSAPAGRAADLRRDDRARGRPRSMR